MDEMDDSSLASGPLALALLQHSPSDEFWMTLIEVSGWWMTVGGWTSSGMAVAGG